MSSFFKGRFRYSPTFFFYLKKLKAIRHSLCTKIQFTMDYKSEMIVLHFFKKKPCYQG